jgi:NitT/TauT family transport system ATP-binding protein
LGIIARTLDPDQGIVQIAGKTPQIGEVGFLFQDYGASLFPWMTCAENIAFALRLKGVDRAARLSKARSIAETVNLGVDLTKYPYELSGGQQQLVAVARALCADPSAIVMDEPFSSLDATVREQVRATVINILCSQGVTVVFVSHNLEDCVVVSDRIVFLTPLPAREFRSETVELSPSKADRKVYSDEFAAIMSRFRKVALEARKP